MGKPKCPYHFNAWIHKCGLKMYNKASSRMKHIMLDKHSTKKNRSRKELLIGSKAHIYKCIIVLNLAHFYLSQLSRLMRAQHLGTKTNQTCLLSI